MTQIIECLGCGSQLGDSHSCEGIGILCLTCRCGATFFLINGQLAPPASLVLAILSERPLAHLDYFLGISAHSSQLKDAVIKLLRNKGSIWSWECDKCKEKTVTRIQEKIKYSLLNRDDLHPELVALVTNVD